MGAGAGGGTLNSWRQRLVNAERYPHERASLVRRLSQQREKLINLAAH